MAQEFSIVPVETLQDRMAFIGFQYDLYRNNPVWVPYLHSERIEFTDRNRHPFFQHAQVAFFRAVREGKTIGTIAAIRNDLYNQFHNEKTGFFGLFDVVEEYPVAEALFNAARDWLRAQGMETMRGPMSYSTNEECGMLLDAFDMPPVLMMTYNPPYYPTFCDRYGFQKARDLYAYRLQVAKFGPDGKALPDRVSRVSEIVQKRTGVQVRKLDMRHFDEEIKLAKRVYNDAWSRNWGFVPMTDAEFDHLAESLKAFLDPDFVFVASIDDKPVGISITLPDVNQAFRHVRSGKLFPIGWAQFLWYKRKIDCVRVVVMGVAKEFQLKGIDAVFYAKTIEEAAKKGIIWGEMSWILDNNVPMRQAIENLGGTIYKTYRVYDYDLKA